MKQIDKILQEALVHNNLLSEAEIKSHGISAQSLGKTLKTYLLDKEILTEKQIVIALSQRLNSETLDFRNLTIDQSVIEKVSLKIAWYYKILPIKEENNVLTIASANPLDVKIQDEIRMHVGMDISICLAEESKLVEALKKYYGFASDTIDRILTQETTKPGAISTKGEQWIEDLEQESDNPTVSNLVNQIILEAYKKRATDIHIEPYRDRVRFRYRIDGTLVDANLPEDVKHFLPSILSRIKILANLSITEKRLPQDGSAVVKTKEQHLDLRISTMPTPRGESMVIRILPTKVMLFSLEKLGFNQTSIESFRDLIRKPHGIIFLTGPTGSGKTTTLYACLNEINSSQRKIITIEDPVEYEMDGITQIQVNPKVKFNFSTGLRSLLRHDPDIIMVGEVRDPETAEIAIKTALTGHLVFSTLHTNDAASGITRLIDMGVEPYLVASSVEAFVAQRLIRILCSKCKEIDPHPMAGIKEEIARSLNLTEIGQIEIYRARGCDACNETGFYGRVAVYEILILNDTIRAVIIEKPRSDHIKRIAVQEGLTTLRQNGWKAVLNGITTPDEVLNVTAKDEAIEVKKKQPSMKTEEAAQSPHDTATIIKDFQYNKAKKSGAWVGKNEYRERVYPRITDPLNIKYKLLNRDPEDQNNLLSDGIEHSQKSEDVSAGGVQFISTEVLPVGSIIDLHIELGNEQKDVECLAKVCRVDEDKAKNIYSIATYYLDISSADRMKINKFIENKLVGDKNIQTKEKSV